ncbi:hypothetical protein H6A19_17040 [Clostridium saudiense]|uniref:Uncharacterized protein n=2 Tax=Clostridia TaxID=186801 RepID=A0ABS2FLX9_9CLOT|nr:hypothetical protein [Clostridium saudiense]MBM6821012.1 hypothetical protein [Clostridium saudiense]
MNNLKTVSIIALIMSVITMIGGIGIVIYYVNNLPIRGLSIFILIMSATMISRTVSLIFKEIKHLMVEEVVCHVVHVESS